MDKDIYIDGNLLVEKGMLYVKEIVAFASRPCSEKVEIISPPSGQFTISEDSGSIFTTYYVSGEVSCYGCYDGGICFFHKSFTDTCNRYLNNIKQIEGMMNTVEPPNDLMNLFYQQQFVSVFGIFEYFLFDTFMGQVCNNFDIYQKVLSSHLKSIEYNSYIKNILRGKHTLIQERTFIEQAEHILYHRTDDVSELFLKAFGISIDLSFLNDYLPVRHNIVHRFGYTVNSELVLMPKEQVLYFIKGVNELVSEITVKMRKIVFE